jgi:hypothetical protein
MAVVAGGDKERNPFTGSCPSLPICSTFELTKHFEPHAPRLTQHLHPQLTAQVKFIVANPLRKAIQLFDLGLGNEHRNSGSRTYLLLRGAIQLIFW